METDRHTKKLKLNNLGTTPGEKPQAKLCVWSRSLLYLHGGWDAAADPSLLSESFILLCLLYSQLGVTHLDTLVTSVQPVCPAPYVTQRTKKEPCKQSEEDLTHHIISKNEINHAISSVLVKIGGCLREHLLNIFLIAHCHINEVNIAHAFNSVCVSGPMRD